MLRVGFFLLIAGSMLWGLAGCGGGEPDPNAPITDVDFNRVCQGEGVARAAAYDAAGPGPHTVIIMTDSTIGAQYDDYFSRFTSDLPEAWFAPIVDGTYDYNRVELVTCIHRTTAELSESCEFEDGYVLNAHSTSFEMSLRAAQSGAVIARETVTAVGECPMMHMFEEGQTNEDYFADVDEGQIMAFIEPHVAP